MLKKLQLKFIVIAMFALGSLILVQTLTVNGISIYQKDLRIKNTLQAIANNNGKLPNGYAEEEDYISSFLNPFSHFRPTVETPFSTRYFVVELRKNVVTRIETDNIAAVDDYKAFDYACQVYQAEPGYGTVDCYRYLYTQDGITPC